MRVLHVTHDMGVGGTEQVVRQLVLGNRSSALGHAILCIDGTVGATGQALREGGVEVRSRTRRPGFDVALVRALRALLREGCVDVLHCHQYTPWSYGALAATGTRVRVVFTEHGRFHPDRSSPKRRLVNRPLAALTDRLVAISAATRDALVRHEWLPRKRIEVIYNGVRTPEPIDPPEAIRARHDIPPDAPLLGTLARLDSIKNQRMMLDAVARLRADGRDARLLLAGDGPERAALERRACELGVTDAVVFAGFVTDIGGYLRALDVFLLTSFSEGTSMTLLEAMSLGLPCVVTAVGGNVELVEDGVSGRVVPSDDASALAATVAALLDAPGEAAALGHGALATFAERFSQERMCEAYARIYREVARPGDDADSAGGRSR